MSQSNEEKLQAGLAALPKIREWWPHKGGLIADMADALEAAQACITELKKDAERLDSLEKALLEEDGIIFGNNPTAIYTTIRAAIDEELGK